MTQKHKPRVLVCRDDPLPRSTADQAKEIKYLAAARRRDALTHPDDCTCDGCKIRHQDETRSGTRTAT